MRRPASTWRILLVSLLVALTGCAPTQPFYLHEDGDLSHYIDKATQAEHPDAREAPLAEVEHSRRPLSLSHPEFIDFWDISLEECVSIALANSKVIRGGSAVRLQNGQLFAGTQQGALVGQPRSFGTAYNPAISETNPGQGVGGLSGFLNNGAGGGFSSLTTDGGLANSRQGVESALAAFDAQLSITGDPGSALFSTTDRPQNVVQSPNSFFPARQRLQNGGLNATISKFTAEGTLFNFSSNTDSVAGNIRGFDLDNPTNPTANQPLFGVWTQTLQAEVRHPLLRGRGAQINRMPIIIARIGTDIETSALQSQLQDTLNNIEVRYWDLYLAYRNLETAKVGRDSALETWRIVYDKFRNDVEPVQAEAQAQEQYYNFRAAVESALRNLYDTENELRLLMGLTATDGRLIRPKDDPTLARVEFDWTEILAEAVARRPELTQQRWAIKQREMELILARNQLLPQLDVGAQFRWLGVGDQLINADRSGIPFKDSTDDTGRGSTAWEELAGGKYQEFSLLFQYQMPIGFRRELAAVRHVQLRLAREKALLEDMELDVSHGLSHALRNLETNYQLAQTNANRWAAAQREVEAHEALYRGGKSPLDIVLEAQRRRAQAQGAFWSAVTEYNKSIADLHTRKGSIMDYDGIGFEEGQWPQKAYWDALARARERDAGWYIDYGWTRPKVISRGPVVQGAIVNGASGESLSAGTAAEELPSPEPTPAQPSRNGTEAHPLPHPQDVHSQPPELGSPQASQLRAPAATAVASVAAPPAAVPKLARPTVSPANYLVGENDNPLRSARRRPVGSGVVSE
jgi:outer membrane protein TolC